MDISRLAKLDLTLLIIIKIKSIGLNNTERFTSKTIILDIHTFR